jgi:hypothetical protein
MSQTVNEKWLDYIQWLLTPEQERGQLVTSAAWGRAFGVNDRTLRRWRTLPEFQALYDEEAAKVAHSAPTSTSLAGDSVADDEVSPDLSDYRVVKSTLLKGAKSGNPKFLELYFRTYGKPFVEEEVASRSTDLAGMDLDALVAAAVAAVDWDVLVEVLGGMGWSLVRAEPDA